MTTSFEAVYRAASYRVRLNGFEVIFRVDQPSASLASYLEQRKVRGAAFITAWNPLSEPQSPYFNDAQQEQLEAALLALGCHCVPGTGGAEDWYEEHYLALPISREMAEALGRRFEQNAILWIEPDGTPRLVMLTPQA